MENTPKSLPMTEKADTPRTNAVAWNDYTSTKGYRDTEEIVSADHARQLERELQSARKDAQGDERERCVKACLVIETGALRHNQPRMAWGATQCLDAIRALGEDQSRE